MNMKPGTSRIPAIELEAASPKSAHGRRARVIQFGSVKVRAPAPDAEELEVNIEAGRLALRRAKKAFMKAGVSLRHGKDIPRYRVDPKRPDILIREMGNQIERGRLVNGSFVIAE